MQIRKYSGGALLTYTPHISTSKNATTSPQSTTTSGAESAEDKIQNEFFEIIGEYGLHNDKDKFLSYASKLLTASQTMNLSGQTKDNITKRDLIKLHSLANQLKENADAHTEAKTKIREENSGSDIALTNTGGMYAINAETGKLTVISPTEYHNNSDKYQLLTNTDLLDLREDSPSLAFDTSILNNLEGTIGMKTITEYIVKTIKDFGTISYQHSGSQYVANSKSIENGMAQILGGAAPEGIYKVSSSSSGSDQGYRNENEMFRAVQYIWSTLNGNMKNTLRATAAAEGLDPNNTLDVFRIIIDAVQLHTTHGRTSSSDVSYDAGASKAAGLTGDVDKNNVQLTYLEAVANGKTTESQWIDLRSNTSISNIHFVGNPYQMLDHSNKPVKSESITSMLLDAQVGQVVDQSSISFGDKIIGMNEKSKILYDSNSPMYRVNLPYDVDYFKSTGKYKPDIGAQEKFDKFIKWVNDSDPTQIMITQKLHDLGLNLSYNPRTSEWKFNNNKEFIMMTGITSHRAVDISDKWKGEVPKQEAKYLYDYLEEHTEFNEAIWNIWGDAESTYKSAIFMPIIDPALATVGTSGEYVPRSYKMDIQNRVRYNNTINNIQTNF